MNKILTTPCKSPEPEKVPSPSEQIAKLSKGQAFLYQPRPGEPRGASPSDDSLFLKADHNVVTALGGSYNGFTWNPYNFDYMPRYIVVPVDLEICVVKK